MVKKVVALPKALVRKLGMVSDKALSAEFGILIPRIREGRRHRGLPALNHVPWTAEQVAVLGTMPDKQAAAVIGVTKNAVFSKRVSLAIPSFGRSREAAQYHWKAADIKQLGKVSDAVLASELSISESVVTAKRHSLGITSSTGTGRPRRPWTKSELAMLGKKADTVIAAETGRGRRHVRAKREELGIPASQQHKSIRWTKALIKRLGKVTDSELAIELGVSAATVALHRRRLIGKRR